MDKFSTKKYFEKLDRYFRAANYLSASQLYLKDNPLLLLPLAKKDVKEKIVGHWGTCPGQNFIYAHLSRAINKYNQKILYISGPGHGGNFFIANAFLEGTYSEVYKKYSEDLQGIKNLCKEFSFPCGVSSHVAPSVPGSVHEGGELGYSLAHGFGTVFDNPDLITAVVVGDGEAETGPLATAWQSNKFINPAKDGAVLPILHLNGFKIANPTVFARMPKSQLVKYFEGLSYSPIFVEGSKPKTMHRKMAKAVDMAIEKIHKIQKNAKQNISQKIAWPVIILRTPKGWTAPSEIDGKKMEGSFRSHQVPISMTKPEHLKILENWLKNYKPQELFNADGKIKDDIKEICPKGQMRMSATPFANAGTILKELKLPNLAKFEVKQSGHGGVKASDMTKLGEYIADVYALNDKNKNFRLFSPDETNSNRLQAVFRNENRQFELPILKTDESISKDGRVMDSYLSEHMCEGWLEGYLLSGRHGAFASYEAFVRVVDSMIIQHSKWLKACEDISWRKPISSLNLILTSTAWQQDHNGFTHQEPGMVEHLVSKKSSIIRAYYPPDANCLLSVFDHALQKKNRINVIVASKHQSHQWLNMKDSISHCKKGLSEWSWAGNVKKGEDVDFVLACCGDTPTLETLATAKLLKEKTSLKFKVVNIVDLLKLQSPEINKRGISDKEFDELFTTNKPVFFNFHAYPHLIHALVYNRTNAKNFHVSGFKEEGAITTAFDMRVLNEIDRFHQVLKICKYVKFDGKIKNNLINEMNEKLKYHKKYIAQNGKDLEEIENWNWNK